MRIIHRDHLAQQLLLLILYIAIENNTIGTWLTYSKSRQWICNWNRTVDVNTNQRKGKFSNYRRNCIVSAEQFCKIYFEKCVWIQIYRSICFKMYSISLIWIWVVDHSLLINNNNIDMDQTNIVTTTIHIMYLILHESI